MSRVRTSHLLLVAALAAGAGVPAAPVAAAPAGAATTMYTITDLGSLGGGSAEATAINALGQVTGASTLAKQVELPCPYPQSPNEKCPVNLDHAFLWSRGTMTDLGTLGGDNSQGVSINDSGEVVGFSELKTGFNNVPFLSTGSGRKLTALSGMVTAPVITDSGQIGGDCLVPNAAESFACVVSSNGTITQVGDTVPTPGFGISCYEVVAINTSGQALADCEAEGLGAPFQGQAAVVWANGTPTVLGTPGTDIEGIALNNNGQVVGAARTSPGANLTGFLWSNGTTTALGFEPAAINNSGVIVGEEFIDTGGTVQNLNTLIPAGSPYQFLNATGINDNGQIAATAEDTATGQLHALLLTPN